MDTISPRPTRPEQTVLPLRLSIRSVERSGVTLEQPEQTVPTRTPHGPSKTKRSPCWAELDATITITAIDAIRSRKVPSRAETTPLRDPRTTPVRESDGAVEPCGRPKRRVRRRTSRWIDKPGPARLRPSFVGPNACLARVSAQPQDRLPDRLRGPLPVTACVADTLADSTRQGKVAAPPQSRVVPFALESAPPQLWLSSA
ncbi:hypothetical protein VTN00DRAFT_1141 [Thermoascus crustaceus]|uniref:uncharacterized protein n=1 Tax=Thermoascus crustaceus TaxID=5088 RepID=UPI003742CC08